MIYSYYVSQVLLVGALVALAWKYRNLGFLIGAIAFAVYLVGNVEMLWASQRLVEAHQSHIDLTVLERSYAIWRFVSSWGFLVGGLGLVVAAILPRAPEVKNGVRINPEQPPNRS